MPGNQSSEKDDGERKSVKIDFESVQVLLAAHSQWLKSHGDNGAQANLRDVDLSGINLEDADLRQVDFRNSKLEGTRLQGAALNYTDLSGATGLLPEQLAGTDLSGATLPSGINVYDRLDHVKDITVSSRKVFFIMMLAVGYTWLTIATTSDVALLTNSPTSPLPIILTKLPISGFYWAAPLILLGLYIYFHLHLQQLWESLTTLPAFFPDGHALYDKVHPWMLTGLIHAHCKHLRSKRPPMSHVQNLISIMLAWWLIPLTIGAVWLRYLPRHDWAGTNFHLAILIVAAAVGTIFYRLAVSTMVSKQRSIVSLVSVKGEGKSFITEFTLLCLVLAVLPLFSFGAMMPAPMGSPTIDPRVWVPGVFTALGYNPYANFANQDISTRPNNWTENNAPTDSVKGVGLQGRDLYRANAVGAFMVKADLREANLQAADLELANLRLARLQDANLRGASLLQADLRESNLAGADLQGAVLLLANLNGAKLRRVNLKEAFLNRADLRRTDLAMADLRDAHLNNADLRGATLELAILGRANLQGSNLEGTQGLNCVQLGSAVLDADTRLPIGLDCPQLGGKK